MSGARQPVRKTQGLIGLSWETAVSPANWRLASRQWPAGAAYRGGS
ncbi:MAG: hypothetical protein H6659_14055 [Ardenticatenaceae bacterium]|nr:hypothetical protein [Ardenticatenaceae bacterium]